MVGNTLKQAQERWKQLSETIQNMSTVNVAETKAAQLERIERARKDYAYFVEYYYPHYCTDKITGEVTPSAKFHIEAAKNTSKQGYKSRVQVGTRSRQIHPHGRNDTNVANVPKTAANQRYGIGRKVRR